MEWIIIGLMFIVSLAIIRDGLRFPASGPLLFMAGIGLFFLLDMPQKASDRWLLAREGVEVEATVIRLYTESGSKGATLHYTAYEYLAYLPDEARYATLTVQREPVSAELWRSLQVGSPLPIRYARSKPQLSSLPDRRLTYGLEAGILILFFLLIPGLALMILPFAIRLLPEHYRNPPEEEKRVLPEEGSGLVRITRPTLKQLLLQARTRNSRATPYITPLDQDVFISLAYLPDPRDHAWARSVFQRLNQGEPVADADLAMVLEPLLH